ncbi:MAG: RNA degradosome polyphosphate kinase, partial [Zymomonas sp.]|nr:RNA degradosome polyphosphate kinase [Zymomonas sp.]
MSRPAAPADIDDPALFTPGSGADRFFNRELSWLGFNRRVLEEACNPAHPLLERLRFLAISGSNLDEFFMVRVAGLKGQQMQEADRLSVDGLNSSQQLAAIIAEADALVESQRIVWRALRGLLAETGITVLSSRTIDEAVTAEELAWLETHFREQIFPILTPQALDPAHPFPFMPNKG